MMITIGEEYGAFKAIKKVKVAKPPSIKENVKYTATCTNCGETKTFKAGKLVSKLPKCTECKHIGNNAKKGFAMQTKVQKAHKDMVKAASKTLAMGLGDDEIALFESQFGEDSERITSLIKGSQTPQGFSLFQLSMLCTLIQQIPKAEERIDASNCSQSSIYAMNALVNTVRELINDVENSQEQADMSRTVTETVLKPLLSVFGQALLAEANSMTNLVNSQTGLSSKEKAKLLEGVQGSFRIMSNRTTDMFTDFYTNLTEHLS